MLVSGLGEDKQFIPYLHPFPLGMMKVVGLGVAVIIVVDGGKALAIYSLQKPCMRLPTPKARPSAIALLYYPSTDERGSWNAKELLLHVDCMALNIP